MDDLSAFLRARLDEDEQGANAILGVNVRADLINGKPAPQWESRGDSVWDTNGIPRVKGTWVREAEHIARWDPARVLAEVEAKRRLVDLHPYAGLMSAPESCEPCAAHPGPCVTLRLLALPYADHPDYREQWRP